MKKLSISIVNTSNRELLTNCLKSIYQQAPDCDFEVLVVDNKSDDGSAEMLAQDFPSVILTRNSIRYGYPQNSNINIAKSKGDPSLTIAARWHIFSYAMEDKSFRFTCQSQRKKEDRSTSTGVARAASISAITASIKSVVLSSSAKNTPE